MGSGRQMGNLISVIIPTRNAAAVVVPCLESLQTQRFKGFDAHVIDAQSSDDTVKQTKLFADRVGAAVRIVSEPDGGVYEAMNKGIAGATGEWLYFMGADDMIHDAAVFADVERHLTAGDADVVYGDVVMKSSGVRCGGESYLDRLLFEGNICHQSVFYRRTVFERVGEYSLRYPIWADWDFNIRCFRHPDIRTRWIDRVIAVYNDKDGLSQAEDPVLRMELPVTLLRDADRRLRRVKKSRSYQYGAKLFGWLD